MKLVFWATPEQLEQPLNKILMKEALKVIDNGYKVTNYQSVTKACENLGWYFMGYDKLNDEYTIGIDA